jgi:subtilisin family serine protease
VSVPADRAAGALRELRSDPDVRWAQRDARVRATAVPAQDTYWNLLWGLDAMEVPDAWQTSTGAGVTVAVVDTGVDSSSPDLAGQLATNPGETGAGRETNGIDDDGDGLVDDWRGWDFAYDDNDTSDVVGHGTHVSGTIVARNGNNEGISGVAPDAKVLMLKGLADDGYGSWSDIADAFDFAGDQGIRIVSASLGGASPVPVIDDVIAQHPDTLYVVAAGNDDDNLDLSTFYPCEALEANVLCVGASDNNDQRASFSNYSPTSVDVFAPGVSVLSTCPGGYCYMDGTSMATPHVSAEAALLLAHDPTLTALQVKQAIMDSADPVPALAPYGHGGGRANARALLHVPIAQPPPDGDGDGVPDAADNCPAQPGPAASHGCPAVSDPLFRPRDPSPGGQPQPHDPQHQLLVRPSLGTPKLSAGKARCGRRACVRSLRVSAATQDATAATVTVAQHRCTHARCAYRTLTTRSATPRSGALVVTLRVKAPAGRLRVTVSATGPGGRSQRTANLTLR